MTWQCRVCGHETVWWKGKCASCGCEQGMRAEFDVRTVPVLDTGIGRALGYADDKAFMQAATEERERAMAILSVEERARLEAAERELERRVIFGDGT